MRLNIDDFIRATTSWERSQLRCFRDDQSAAAAQLIGRGEFTAEYLDALAQGIRLGIQA